MLIVLLQLPKLIEAHLLILKRFGDAEANDVVYYVWTLLVAGESSAK